MNPEISQTNSSISKAAYRFSKQKRFSLPNSECKIAFYSNKSHLSSKKASIGSGKKYDFTKDLTNSPPATQYHFKSCFGDKNKGKSFLVSRDQSPDQCYLPNEKMKNPGPGQYNSQAKTKMSHIYTMRLKTLNLEEKKRTNNFNPGPGSYNSVEMEPKSGKFFIAKYSDTKQFKMYSKTPRFKTISDAPGPSSYQQIDSLNPNQQYILSKNSGQGKTVFCKTVRKTFTDKINERQQLLPGPGNYNFPSEFQTFNN